MALVGACKVNGTAIENWPPKDVDAELPNQAAEAWDTSSETVDVVEGAPDLTENVKLKLDTLRLVT